MRTTSTPDAAGGDVSTLRRALRNLGHLLAGRATAALLGLAATALMAQSLPPTQFGLVILLHTYVLTWHGVLNCKPFEAIIRYGVEALDKDDEPKLRRLLRLCLLVDAGTSLLAAILAVSLAGLIGSWLDWDTEFVELARAYSLIVVTGITGTANGILRLFNRFDLLARQLAIGPILRLSGALVAWHLSLGISGFIAAWGVALLCEQLYMMFRGWRELRRQLDTPSLVGLSLTGWRTEFPGIARFIAIVYWQSNLDLLPKHIVTLVVGAFLGAADAGLYRLARELSMVLQTPAVLIRQVLFPDLTRLWNRGGRGMAWILTRTIVGATAGGLSFVLIAVFWGQTLLELFAGKAYSPAATVLTWLFVAGTLDLATSVLRVAGYAMGNAGEVLRLNFLAAILYGAALVAGILQFGLDGAGMAACVVSLVTLLGMLGMIRRRWRQQPITGSLTTAES